MIKHRCVHYRDDYGGHTFCLQLWRYRLYLRRRSTKQMNMAWKQNRWIVELDKAPRF